MLLILLIHRCQVTNLPVTAHGPPPKDEDVASAPQESEKLYILQTYPSLLVPSRHSSQLVINLNMQT